MDITITITGTTPVLQHNIRLADPMDPMTKRLAEATAALKRDKTDSAYIAKAKAEWFGGLYHDPTIGIFVPSSWITGSFIRGGVNYGRKGTAVKQSLIVNDFMIPLIHDGPSDLEKMWENPEYRDTRGAKVGQSVVMRTRPRFPRWALECEAYLDETMLDFEILQVIAQKAGTQVGLGDYRPEKGGPFGRYEAEIKPT